MLGKPASVPKRPKRSRRLATAARWPVGLGLTAWRYMWRTTPMHRSELTGVPDEDGPPPIPGGVDGDEIQLPEDGAGALFHRIYRTRIRDARLTPIELFERLAANLNDVAPSEFASFEKVRGEQDSLSVRDEYVARMPGPWDGPVRVIDRTPTSFRLVTLDGHLEAGQIEFRASAMTCSSSRSNPGRGAATACPMSCMTGFGCRRRSSSTCGPRFSSVSSGCRGVGEREA